MITRASRMLPRIQQIVDALAAAALALAGALMLFGYNEPKAITRTLQYVASTVWAGALTASAVATLTGVIVRSDRITRLTSFGYSLELWGWSATGGCVIIYWIANTYAGGSGPGNAALFALGALLLGKFLRRLAAVLIARHEVAP